MKRVQKRMKENKGPLPPGPRVTFSACDFEPEDQALRASGLLGPVRLFQEAQVGVFKSNQ